MKTTFHSLSVGFAKLALAFCLIPASGRAEGGFTLETAQAAADKGSPEAERFLGNAYEFGKGVRLDYAKAADYFQKAADQGNAMAQNDLGSLYAQGSGVKQDYVVAAQWYRKAAERGDALAEYNYGKACLLGRGVSKDMVKATNWLQKAAVQNQSDALLALGDLYMVGDQGVRVNLAEAYRYYTNAVALGRWECLGNLGLIYQQGAYQIPRNPEQALQYYWKAAADGDGDAMVNLGRLYQNGIWVQKDLVEAYKWFTLALQQGVLAAKNYMEMLDGSSTKAHLKNVLTPNQIAEALRRANDFTKNPTNSSASGAPGTSPATNSITAK
jgi:TPR repeat protein